MTIALDFDHTTKDSDAAGPCALASRAGAMESRKMHRLQPSMTLAEVVDAFPQLAREFERRGLDYCCNGSRTLGVACELAGLDPLATISELCDVSPISEAGEWTTMSLGELVDHIQATHHRSVTTEIPRITALIDKVVEVHGVRHPELVEIAACFAELVADLVPHMAKEERVLFPMIRELANSPGPMAVQRGLSRSIVVMLGQHDAVADILGKLRHLTGNYTPPPDSCATYAACFNAMAELEADTHLHMHKENNVLFPLVMRLESQA